MPRLCYTVYLFVVLSVNALAVYVILIYTNFLFCYIFPCISILGQKTTLISVRGINVHNAHVNVTVTAAGDLREEQIKINDF
jgi:hypothetical protein